MTEQREAEKNSPMRSNRRAVDLNIHKRASTRRLGSTSPPLKPSLGGN